MNIGFHNNIQNNSPNFGMAVKTTYAAERIIEKQVRKMSPEKGKEFLSNIGMIKDANQGLSPDIKLRVSQIREALVAEVKDPVTGKIKKFAQKLFNPTGDVTPLNKTTAEVDKIVSQQKNINKLKSIMA